MVTAQYIMGPFGPKSNLREHGLSIAARGGKNAKKTGGGGSGPETGCAAASTVGEQ